MVDATAFICDACEGCVKQPQPLKVQVFCGHCQAREYEPLFGCNACGVGYCKECATEYETKGEVVKCGFCKWDVPAARAVACIECGVYFCKDAELDFLIDGVCEECVKSVMKVRDNDKKKDKPLD